MITNFFRFCFDEDPNLKNVSLYTTSIPVPKEQILNNIVQRQTILRAISAVVAKHGVTRAAVGSLIGVASVVVGASIAPSISIRSLTRLRSPRGARTTWSRLIRALAWAVTAVIAVTSVAARLTLAVVVRARARLSARRLLAGRLFSRWLSAIGLRRRGRGRCIVTTVAAVTARVAGWARTDGGSTFGAVTQISQIVHELVGEDDVRWANDDVSSVLLAHVTHNLAFSGAHTTSDKNNDAWRFTDAFLNIELV